MAAPTTTTTTTTAAPTSAQSESTSENLDCSRTVTLLSPKDEHFIIVAAMSISRPVVVHANVLFPSERRE